MIQSLSSRFFQQAFFFATAAVVFGVSGCSSNNAPATSISDDNELPFCQLGPACQAISAACMPKDDGTPGPVHDCHLTGMTKGVESDCETQRPTCVTTCINAHVDFDAGGFDLYATCKDGSTN